MLKGHHPKVRPDKSLNDTIPAIWNPPYLNPIKNRRFVSAVFENGFY